MRFTPPMTTKAVRMARRMPVYSGGRPTRDCMAPAISVDWAMLPMPKQATPPSRANSTASHLWPVPFSM